MLARSLELRRARQATGTDSIGERRAMRLWQLAGTVGGSWAGRSSGLPSGCVRGHHSPLCGCHYPALVWRTFSSGMAFQLGISIIDCKASSHRFRAQRSLRRGGPSPMRTARGEGRSSPPSCHIRQSAKPYQALAGSGSFTQSGRNICSTGLLRFLASRKAMGRLGTPPPSRPMI